MSKTVIFENLKQGTEEWLKQRSGILTASEIGKLMTKYNEFSNSKTAKDLISEKAAQRIDNVIEETPKSFAMERGHWDEEQARNLYSDKVADVKQIGFMKKRFKGYWLGYSPDGLVGEDGLIEIKSRAHKYQLQTICFQSCPADYTLQIQTGLLVSGRKWCDFISYPAMGGGKMIIIRVFPDKELHKIIKKVAYEAEQRIRNEISNYQHLLKAAEQREMFSPDQMRFIDAERCVFEPEENPEFTV